MTHDNISVSEATGDENVRNTSEMINHKKIINAKRQLLQVTKVSREKASVQRK